MSRNRNHAAFVGLIAAFIILSLPARAKEVSVAVAANFTAPAKEIAKLFHDATGADAQLSFGPSGEFYTQISQGGPYDVFLSADAERPKKAEDAGLAVAGTRFTYAVGKLVLWSTKPGLVDDHGMVLHADNFAKIAIADPKLAPYGAAAVETMQKLGVWESLQPKLVQGTSIAQAQQFVASGSAELGFVALSQVITTSDGSKWLVPQGLYAPIRQDAVLLKHGESNDAAHTFLTFLKGETAHGVIKRFGYSLE